MISRIKITLFDLFDEYKGVACGSLSPTLATSLGMTNVSHDVGCDKDQMDDILEYKMFLSKKRKVDNDKSDLKLYLEEKNSDVLDYWSRCLAHYSNLPCMARDVFTIPISTVPSESAFSIGNKLIVPWKDSPWEMIIQMLACYEDCLKQKASYQVNYMFKCHYYMLSL